MEQALPRTSTLPPDAATPRKYSEWQIYWRFFKYILPYKSKVFLGILLVFVGVPFGQLGVFINKYLIDEVILNVESPAATRFALFWAIIGVQAAMWFIAMTTGMVRQVLGWYLDTRVTITLRRIFYDHLQRLSLRFHRSRPIGEHMYRSTADVGGGVVTMITDIGPDLIEDIYRILWAAALISLVDWKITVLVVGYIVPYTVGSHYFYTKRQHALRGVKVQEQARAAALRDGIAGAKTVKAFGRIRFQTRKYTGQLIRTQRAQLRDYFTAVLTDHVLWLLQFLLKHGMWFYVGYQTMVGRLTLGEFTVVWALGRNFEAQMEAIIKLLQNVRLHLVPAERMLETLDVHAEIADAPDARPMPPVRGRVEFRDVHFAYDPGVPILRGVSFTLEPGQTAAFVGPSGAGKSTILYLLLRLQEPTSGQILVDGIDIRTVKMDSLREQIGVVLQDTFLFGGSVADNIRWGNLRATDDEVRKAAELADITPFIEALPDSFDTDLGEGTKLSGGQRQRLGIARALIRDPKILILDEATASLDIHSEETLLRTFDRAMAGRTTLMISHRLVTVTHVDVIFVIDRGQIVERGTHEELLTSGGLYTRMWAEQTEVDGISRETMRQEWNGR